MGLTDEQRAARQAFIGGSDAPALAGVNPPNWSQPIDVYLDKVGQGVERRQSGLMALGTLMEDLVFQLATEATGITWRRASRSVRSRQYPWAGGHVDRYGTDPAGVSVIGEGKWSQRRDGWGDSWQLVDLDGGGQVYLAPTVTQVPVHYAVQVQHYLAVTGRQAGVLAVLLGYADFRWYVLPRDEELIAKLMQIEEAFWTNHVVPRVPPEPDGSPGYGAHLRRRYGTDDGMEAVATPEQQQLAKVLHDALLGETRAKAEADLQRQRMMESMAGTSTLVGPGFRIAWRQNRPTTKVQWEPWVTDLLARTTPDLTTLKSKAAREAMVRELAAAAGFATTEPGARPFKPEYDDMTEDSDAATA